MLVVWSPGVTIPSSSSEIATTGYRLYMDGGNDGIFKLVHDGRDQPGILEFRVTSLEHQIQPGQAYRFAVAELNYNGEGARSDPATLHICLSPANFSAPTYVASTETTLTISWRAPNASNGCPITKYQLFRDTGSADAISVQVGGDLEPHILSSTITLAAGDTSKTFRA
jgi:hypothetical protein